MYEKNPLLDKEFLKQLDSQTNREIYARIISLTFQEQPVEQIEGRVTQGSINIDGASAVRRTCSLSLVAKELNINEFYWGIKNKFKLEIGMKNNINSNYPDIIWFPQGVYVITSFNTNQSTNNYTVSISGKDKMCLLNGDLGGNLPASVDFGVKEIIDLEEETVTKEDIPIKYIIREALHAYALEPYHNIIINDLEEAGLELLEYRGDAPLYLLYNIDENAYTNATLNGDMKVWEVKNNSISTSSKSLKDDSIIKFADLDDISENASVIVLEDKVTRYHVATIEYGDVAGYRIIELIYAGDLISSIGETITSILDKIKNMLGEFEYFYDLDGRFIFQRKKTYVQSVFNAEAGQDDNDRYINNFAYNTSYAYKFEGGNLIASYQNNPNLQNLKNDYSIWGNRKSISGAEVPIHYRYAIDKKPEVYKCLDWYEVDENKTPEDKRKNFKHSTLYTTLGPEDERIQKYLEMIDVENDLQGGIEYNFDWRELIYQMATDYYKWNQKDDFAQLIATAGRSLGPGQTDLYQNGTGYEQYYIDIQGFWRQLYNPDEQGRYIETNDLSTKNDLYTNYKIRKYEPKDDKMDILIYENKLINKPQLYPLIDWLDLVYKKTLNYKPTNELYNYYITSNNVNGFEPITINNYSSISFKEYFRLGERIPDSEDSSPLKEKYYFIHCLSELSPNDIEFKDWYIIKDSEYVNINSWLDKNLKEILTNNSENFQPSILCQQVIKNNISFDQIENNLIVDKEISLKYYSKIYDTIRNKTNHYSSLYWNKSVYDAPDTLNFWFDFLDGDGELDQFAVFRVGDRTKVVNDKDVKSVYHRNVPEVLYISSDNDFNLIEKANYWHYTRIKNLPEEYFSISARGKSAHDELENLMYNHSYCIESITLSSLPIYYLQPNTRILVIDESSKINGEYLISKLTIPLQYNGMMTITATKAPTRLY